MSDPLIGNWRAISLRASAFLASSIPTDEGNHIRQWWNEAVGSQFLESSQHRPDGDVTLYVGKTRVGGQLIMEARPDRVDWHMQAVQPDVPLGLATLGAARMADFHSTVGDWLGIIESAPLTRLAFGADLVSQVESAADAYRNVARIIGSDRDLYSSGVSDLAFRVNRPRVMSDRVVMNRVAAWSAATFKRLEITVGADGPLEQLEVEHYASRLELDINTAPTATLRDGLAQRFTNLIEAGFEIAREGDIP